MMEITMIMMTLPMLIMLSISISVFAVGIGQSQTCTAKVAYISSIIFNAIATAIIIAAYNWNLNLTNIIQAVYVIFGYLVVVTSFLILSMPKNKEIIIKMAIMTSAILLLLCGMVMLINSWIT